MLFATVLISRENGCLSSILTARRHKKQERCTISKQDVSLNGQVLLALNLKTRNHPDKLTSINGQLLPWVRHSSAHPWVWASPCWYLSCSIRNRTQWSLQEWDNSYPNAFDNKHPSATETNAIKRIEFWHKKTQWNDMMYWQNFNYMMPKRQLKRVRPLLIGSQWCCSSKQA